MSIVIKKAGILDTMQDLGRVGFRKLGINPNGAMDTVAARIINTLLRNKENEGVLEMHFPGPKIEFKKDCIFAIGGGDFCPQKNKTQIQNWSIEKAVKGDILEFDRKISGNRSYLAVKGGFKFEKWLDSSSTNLRAAIGGISGRSLIDNDILEFSNAKQTGQEKRFRIGQSLLPAYSTAPTIRILAGAEYRDLTALSEMNFLEESYTIASESDRMGFRLSGKPLHLLSNSEMVSSGVNFGTIQLLPNGQLIVLMADHQTTGGYPRIANIIAQDLPLIAQLNSGDQIDFQIVNLKQAEKIQFEFEKDLSFLRFGLCQ